MKITHTINLKILMQQKTVEKWQIFKISRYFGKKVYQIFTTLEPLKDATTHTHTHTHTHIYIYIYIIYIYIYYIIYASMCVCMCGCVSWGFLSYKNLILNQPTSQPTIYIYIYIYIVGWLLFFRHVKLLRLFYAKSGLLFLQFE